MTRWTWLAIVLAGCGFDISLTPGDSGGTRDGAIGSDGDLPPEDADAPMIDAPPLAPLVDRGLVARYFLDEAASGQTPALLVDSAGDPLPLPITYGQAVFAEDSDGNRGLRWSSSQSSGKAELALGMTKLRTRIAMVRTVTIEVVVQITAAGAAGSESQITGLRGGNPDFMLTALGQNDLRFFKPFGTEGATWTGANTQQRMVLHLVFDTTRMAANERIELFRNGIGVPKTTGSAPTLNSTVGLGAGDAFLVGNRQNQDRSIAGMIYYVAYYDIALSTAEMASNAQRLLASDDL